MINGLQLLVYLPLVNLKFPENMAKVCESITAVATFGIDDINAYNLTKPFFGDLLQPPFDEKLHIDYEEEHFKTELEEIGFESSYITVSLDTPFLLIFITTVGLFISTLLGPLSWTLKSLSKIRDWIDRKLKWNWTIRLLMESLIDLSFGTFICIRYIEGSSFGAIFNLSFAYALFCVTCALPIFLQVFYQVNFKRMSNADDVEFDKKYGAAYEGLKKD